MLVAATITEKEMRKVVICGHPPRSGVPVSFYRWLARKRCEPVQDITSTYIIEQVCLDVWTNANFTHLHAVVLLAFVLTS